MTKEQIAAIRARLDAATPGNWTAKHEAVTTDVGEWGLVAETLNDTDEQRAADARLIANAPTDLRALLAEVERLTNDLAMARQVSGELCEACGWAMKFPGEPCRCALLDEVERLKSDPLPAAAWVREVERAAYRRGAQEASERAKAEVERLTNALAAHRDEVPAQDSAKDVVEWQMTNSPVGTTHAYLDGVDLRVRWDGQDAAWDATRYGRCATEAEARRAATAAARGMK